jgi:hypothetical protein
MVNRKNSGSNYLASLAVFRELYNTQADIYGVIAEFLKSTISTNCKHEFSLTEISELLNDEFGFKIPQAVIKAALKRIDFLKKKNKKYYVENLAQFSNAVSNKRNQITTNNETILKDLFKFVESHLEEELSESEQNKVVNSFSSFLLDDSNGKQYSEFISAYFIKNKEDQNFLSQVNLIKEGVIIYSGLKYNPDINDFGEFRTDLVIFIETEILFHLAGYNGELFKTISMDFFNFVKEINRKSKNHKIILKYFEQTELEINGFFNSAEYILSGKGDNDPSKTAMVSILDGCKNPSDIVEKKVKFFEILKRHHISRDTYDDYYKEKNFEYLLIDESSKDQISEELDIENISQYTLLLNNVNILRGEKKENNFNNIGYLLLSGNSKTLKIAWHKLVKKKGDVPLASSLSFLINKFWFKLNKGFGGNGIPITFDVISKAQIILSSSLNNSIASIYDELNSELKEGQLTKEEAIARIVELRQQVKKPEEILIDDLENVLDTISEENIDRYIEEQDFLKSKNKKKDEENLKLKKEIEQNKLQLAKEVEERKISERRLAKSNLDAQKELLKAKTKNFKELDNLLKRCKEEIRIEFNCFKLNIGGGFFTYYLLLFYAILKFGWSFYDWFSIVITALPVIFSLIHILKAERKFDLVAFIKSKNDNLADQIFKKNNFSFEEYNSLKEKIDQIEAKIIEFQEILV